MMEGTHAKRNFVTVGPVSKTSALDGRARICITKDSLYGAFKTLSGERISWNQTDGWHRLPRDIGLATAIVDGINPDIAHVGIKGAHATEREAWAGDAKAWHLLVLIQIRHCCIYAPDWHENGMGSRHRTGPMRRQHKMEKAISEDELGFQSRNVR
ncbi:hypothetical protein B0H10DRAFT_1968864 [Mycena sp. CBHHK59/15]|nr:hypothetical protein B0H10DRAFT_1968864 [Mycena sp. CBHHK59/15]